MRAAIDVPSSPSEEGRRPPLPSLPSANTAVGRRCALPPVRKDCGGDGGPETDEVASETSPSPSAAPAIAVAPSAAATDNGAVSANASSANASAPTTAAVASTAPLLAAPLMATMASCADTVAAKGSMGVAGVTGVTGGGGITRSIGTIPSPGNTKRGEVKELSLLLAPPAEAVGAFVAEEESSPLLLPSRAAESESAIVAGIGVGALRRTADGDFAERTLCAAAFPPPPPPSPSLLLLARRRLSQLPTVEAEAAVGAGEAE